MLIGTSHFKTRIHAYRYYRSQGFIGTLKQLADFVDDKHRSGEIHYKEPPPREGYEIVILPTEGRYAYRKIDEDSSVYKMDEIRQKALQALKDDNLNEYERSLLENCKCVVTLVSTIFNLAHARGYNARR